MRHSSTVDRETHHQALSACPDSEIQPHAARHSTLRRAVYTLDLTAMGATSQARKRLCAHDVAAGHHHRWVLLCCLLLGDGAGEGGVEAQMGGERDIDLRVSGEVEMSAFCGEQKSSKAR